MQHWKGVGWMSSCVMDVPHLLHPDRLEMVVAGELAADVQSCQMYARWAEGIVVLPVRVKCSYL